MKVSARNFDHTSGNTMKYIVTGLMLFLISNTAMAVDTVGKVSHLYSSQYGRVYFRIEGDTCKTECL